MNRLRQALVRPVDGASTIVFRIAFGLLLCREAIIYWRRGWVREYWIDPEFHFTYFGFDWVRPLSATGTYVEMALLIAVSLTLALGLAYRVSAALFFLIYAHLFLIEQSSYLNHAYLICLLALMLCFIPAHRGVSVDAWLRPALRSSTVPVWAVWLLRAQIGIVYFYGGLAKLNGDWLRGEPMRSWLPPKSDLWLIGPWLEQESAAWFFSYGGLLFDLLLVPALLWRRTRVAAFLVAVAFHVTNSQLFFIGVFPWLGIAATTLFFPPDWPRKVWSWVRRADPGADADADADADAGAAAEPAAETDVVTTADEAAPAAKPHPLSLPATIVLLLFLVIQLVVPLRHLAYPGPVHWTEEGHRFSWRMKLRGKDGTAWFRVIDANGDARTVYSEALLRPWQQRKMSTRPDMIQQFARHLAEREREAGNPGVQVTASVMVSLHGRPHQLLIDPRVDLAAEPRTLRPASWIEPLKHDLPERP